MTRGFVEAASEGRIPEPEEALHTYIFQIFDGNHLNTDPTWHLEQLQVAGQTLHQLSQFDDSAWRDKAREETRMVRDDLVRRIANTQNLLDKLTVLSYREVIRQYHEQCIEVLSEALTGFRTSLEQVSFDREAEVRQYKEWKMCEAQRAYNEHLRNYHFYLNLESAVIELRRLYG